MTNRRPAATTRRSSGASSGGWSGRCSWRERRKKYCFLHYPPRYRGYVCPEILALFETYGVTRCYYGHLHADSIRLALEGPYRGTEYRLVSADHVDFQPQRIG